MKKLENKYQKLLNVSESLQDLKAKDKYKLVDYLEEKTYTLQAELSDLKSIGRQYLPDGKYTIEWAEKYNQFLQAKSVKESIERNLYPAKQEITEENQGEIYPEYHIFHWLNGPEQNRMKIWEKIMQLAGLQVNPNKNAIASLLWHLKNRGYFNKKVTEIKYLMVGGYMFKTDLTGYLNKSNTMAKEIPFDNIPYFMDLKI